MKKLITLMTLTACALSLNATGFAAEPKKKEAAAPAAEAKKPEAKPAEKPAEKAEAKADKPIPMYSRADSIDAAAKTFTNKRKDGVEVKHKVTAETTIMNGEKAATLGDIKVGDYVSGLRLKKSDTEYEVVKITKFGPAAPKEEKKEDKPAAKKPE